MKSINMTVEETFNAYLSPELAKLAIANCCARTKKKRANKHLPTVLSSAFDWQGSKQGHSFWRNIQQRMHNGEFKKKVTQNYDVF